MFYNTGRTCPASLQAATVLLIAAAASASGIIDTAQEITEHLRIQEFTAEGYDVVELFRAETTEDLETATINGYPMPWLEEILSDETIPEEDRYWLDCRIRSVIAQELHLFFDREGNPFHIEASWIGPGEHYWQEHMMVRPVLQGEGISRQMPDESDFQDLLAEEADRGHAEEAFSENSPTLMPDPPGEILNLYGEHVGDLAVVNRFVSLSRDASIGAVQSGGNNRMDYRHRTPYACILYPDASFVETSFEQTGFYSSVVSEDGSIIVFACIQIAYPQSDDQVVDVFIFDSSGEIVGRISPPEQFLSSSNTFELSPSGQISCCGWDAMSALIFDITAQGLIGRVIPSEPGRTVQTPSFSPGGRYLCTGGHSAGRVFSIPRLEQVWQEPMSEATGNPSIINCSEDASVIAQNWRLRRAGGGFYGKQSIYVNEVCIETNTYSDPIRETDVSPSGRILVSQKREGFYSKRCMPPLVVQLVEGGE